MKTQEHPQEKPSARALRELRRRLDNGDFPEGSKLPPERKLAADMAISRRALREALGELEAEDRIWRGVGRGTIIAPHSLHNKPNKANDLTSPAELMDARLALEPSIAKLAAVHATTQDLGEMHRCLKKSAGITGYEGWDKWDGALHHAIGRSSHNELIKQLFSLLSSAREHTQWGRLRKASLTRERIRIYTRQHRAILAAISERDTEQAAHCMRIHLLTVKQTLLDPWNDRTTPASNSRTKQES